MIQVHFYDSVEDNQLQFAVIVARSKGKWVFCRHKERTTYECPGGHREAGETILETAWRELREETGAENFTLRPVCVYSVTGKTRVAESRENEEVFGMLYVAEIFSFGELHSEMEQILITPELVTAWTYPLIQPQLIQEIVRRGRV